MIQRIKKGGKSAKIKLKTYSIIQSGEIGISVLKPFIEVHGVIGGVAFTIGGEAKNGQGVGYFFQID